MRLPKPKLPPALGNAPLRRLFAMQLPADFADNADLVAIGALLAFVWGVEPVVYGLFALAVAAPYLLIGPFAGVLVDRLPLRRILVLSNLGRALATVALFFAGSWQALLALLFLRAAADSFFGPAKQAALQALTSTSDRASANGLSQMIGQIARILSPSLGGALLIFLEPSALFLANSALSLLAALAALGLGPIARAASAPDRASAGMLAEIRAGLGAIWGLRLVRAVVLFHMALLCAVYLYSKVLAPFLETLGLEAHQIGFPISAAGLGGLLGSLLVATRGRMARPFLWVLGGLAPGAAVLLALGLIEITGATPGLWMILLLFFFAGMTGSIGFLPLAITLQNIVPEEKMGRVSALKDAMFGGMMMLSPFLGAALAQVSSYGAPMLAGGMIIFALAFWALRLDRIKAFRAGPP